MDAISAVVEVVRANEELTSTLDTYDGWFESLVGKTVTVAKKIKKKTRYIMAEVEEFEAGEGWLVRDIESDDVFDVSFEDFVAGRAWIVRDAAARRLKFEDENVV